MRVRGLAGLNCGDYVHAFNHAIERNELCSTNADRSAFLRALRESPRDHLDIVAWCIVGNHFHLLLRLLGNPSAMADFLRIVQAKHALYHSRIYGRRGALHMGRYGRRLVDSALYARIVVAYIHANRTKDGFCSDPATDPWSSHRAYLGLAEPDVVELRHRDELFGGVEGYRAEFAALLSRWTPQGHHDMLQLAVLRLVSHALREHPHLAKYERGLRCAALVDHAGLSAARAAARVGLRPGNAKRSEQIARVWGAPLLAEVETMLQQPDRAPVRIWTPGSDLPPAREVNGSGQVYLPHGR